MRVLIRWLRGWGMVAAAFLCAVLALLLLAVPPVMGWMHPRVSREALLATLPGCRGGDLAYWDYRVGDASLPVCGFRYVRAGDVIQPAHPELTGFDPNAGAWLIAGSGGIGTLVSLAMDDPAVIRKGGYSTGWYPLVHQDLVGGPQPGHSAAEWLSMYSARDRAFPAWWPGWLSGEWRVPVGIVATGLAVTLALVDVGRHRRVHARPDAIP